MAWDCGTGHYFVFLLRRGLSLNIFPFQVTTAKLIGEFCNNRRSAAHGCPRFTYSFVFHMLRHCYWRWRSAAKKKILRKLLIVAVNLLRFAYWRSEGAPLRL
jgi:hypothetical protein